MYDWANSAFQTTVVTVLIGPYLTTLAQQAVGDNGVVLRLGALGAVTAKSFYPYCIALSVVLQTLMLPLLGAAADYSRRRKGLMMALCYTGASATCLMVFLSAETYLAGGLLLVGANVCFGAALVLYNAFLNDVAAPPMRDAVSSRGYAMGYLGGGLLLACNLALIAAGPRVGIGKDLAVRLSLLSAGLWWGGFGAFAFSRIAPRPASQVAPPGRSAIRAAAGGVVRAFTDLRGLPHTLRFLAAYMLFNDGIQTVISIASVFLAQELFVARGLPVDESFLIMLILMVQLVGIGGALLFEQIARRVGTKRAIVLSLVLWIGVVIYAYGFLESRAQAWAMGAVIALVLGGSQALSRALFSLMIPAGREASFFGLYEIADRGTSWIGPLVFGAVAGATNSYRQAILSLVFLFVAGLVVLAATDTDRAIAEAARPAAAV
ncbi:MAG: MFS transporter [Acidobacteria bacterium]|nr:MFS transporter [Acidobacteriota bacterium]